jgi:hypothetical protein
MFTFISAPWISTLDLHPLAALVTGCRSIDTAGTLAQANRCKAALLPGHQIELWSTKPFDHHVFLPGSVAFA